VVVDEKAISSTPAANHPADEGGKEDRTASPPSDHCGHNTVNAGSFTTAAIAAPIAAQILPN
jgi:hypothetical protein